MYQHVLQILYNAPFKVSQETENSFFHANVHTLQEASSLPRNTRISVKGTIQTVSPVKQGASYQLQFCDIQDDNNKKVRVNLWGDKCQHNIPDPGTSVLIENVVTTVYQDNMVLTATPETAFLESKVPSTSDNVTIISISEKRGDVTFFDQQDKEYVTTLDIVSTNIHCKTIKDIVPLLPLPVTITMTTKAGKNIVTTITVDDRSEDNFNDPLHE
ncbi:uncharacterized protein [Asterias amurensis]|uniref:uncharacterized protein n=1 Tax=Asterias amurensis TaxID=7602 RepID=UPI003AB5A5BC